MAEGKKLVWLALPFCAGIVLGELTVKILQPSDNILYAAAGVLPAIIFWLSVIACRKSVSSSGNIIFCHFISLTACILCGILCSTTSILTQSYASEDSFADIWMKKSRIKVEDLIDNIPYKNNDTNALAKALLTGNRSSLTHEAKENFRQSGASHLLALSGMHLGILYLIFSHLLDILGNHRWTKIIKYIITISCTWFYSGMTGWSPSIVRALLFIIIRETAGLTGRKCNLTDSLSAALVIQCTVNPGVVHSVSFQMSYLAVAAIAVIFPHLKNWFPSEGADPATKVARKIWECAALSLSCQITTGPLAWWKFGSLPIYFLITNLLAVPVTTIAIPAVILSCICCSAGICIKASASVSEFMLESLSFILSTISSMNNQ